MIPIIFVFCYFILTPSICLYSGLIGKSWSMLFAGAGYDVTLFDVIPGAVTSALQDIEQQLRKLEKDGMLRGSLGAKEQLGLIKEATDLKDCVQGAIHVQVWAEQYVPS